MLLLFEMSDFTISINSIYNVFLNKYIIKKY